MRNHPFNSEYRADFHVLEERDGDIRRYPATSQLPILLRALTQEFKLFLPAKIANADRRADDFVKIQRKLAVNFFCHWINSNRSDDLQLFTLLDHDRVARVAIVQQITEHTPRGARHHFKFYAGHDFFPEMLLSRRRLVFSGHALERFSTRVPGVIGSDLKTFLMTVFEGPHLLANCGDDALAIQFLESIIAMPILQEGNEIFVRTCLTVNEMHSLEVGLPPCPFVLHYDNDFKNPRIRNWSPFLLSMDLKKRWEHKIQLPKDKPQPPKQKWSDVACRIRDVVQTSGHGPGSRLVFLDNVPGPASLELKPGQDEFRHSELESYKKLKSNVDWEAAFDEMDGQINDCDPQSR